MTRHLIIFLATFATGAVIALGARAVRHNPHSEAAGLPAHVASASGQDAASPVPPARTPDSTSGTVNTVCAICGMDVDPRLPAADYKGYKIGFGCAACPPKFARNPDKWGPSALKNEVLED